MGKLSCILLILILIISIVLTGNLAEAKENGLITISSEKYGKGYRYNTHGWIYLHIEGDPYERGYQHGYLLANEIVDHIQRWIHIFPQKWSWKLQRFNAMRLFWDKYPEEYKQEIKGIADGCAARGGKIDGSPVSHKDILTLNEIYELLTRFRNYYVYYYVNPLNFNSHWLLVELYNIRKDKELQSEYCEGACSAFIATGDATKDGRIVAAHSTRGYVIQDLWWHMYVTERWNLLLDIKPVKGYRMFMSTAPGLIWSDEDFYQNSAGMILMETTLCPLGAWNRRGDPIVVRARKAIQYSDSINEMIDFFLKNNNGLFANEWIMGDTKTGEIATLELALFNHALKRTKNGFYWSVNRPRDDKVRWELNSFFGLGIFGRLLKKDYIPGERDYKFEEFEDEFYGEIDVDIAKKIMSTYPICDSLEKRVIMMDCKITDSELVKNQGFWAIMGNPAGVDLIASDYPLKKSREEYTDSPSCGWIQIFGRSSVSNHKHVNYVSNQEKKGEIVWGYQTADGDLGNAIYSSPTIDDEIIYVTSWNGNISALDINSGGKIWEKNIGWNSESSPTVFDKKVYVGSSEGLYALDKETGTVFWKNGIGGVSSKPIFHDNIVYCGSHGGNVYAFDSETGDLKWKFETDGEIYSSPTIDSNVLFIGSNDKYLYAINTKTGDLKWKYKTEGAICSSPYISNNVVYFGSWDSRLYALEAETGKFKWKFTTGWGVDSSPAIHDDTVYVGSEDNNFYALDAEDGTIKWMFTANAGIYSSPTVYGGLVFFGCSDGKLYALNASIGNVVWSAAPDYYIDGIYNYVTRPIVSSPVIYEGKVFVGSTNGKIYCFDAGTFEPPVAVVEEIEVPVDAWLFMILPLLCMILITMFYLYWTRKRVK
jgi:outer membrane protein assembly factor BamB